MASNSPMQIFVLMGTAGCGKSSVAQAMQNILQCQYLEGDSLHPPANIEKMANGHPLNDEDRWPWLGLIRDKLIEISKDHVINHGVTIVTCSALRKVYRDILRDIDPSLGNVTFVYLKGSIELLSERIAVREGHFMAPAMLKSQLETLEEPNPNVEEVIVADIRFEPSVVALFIVEEARRRKLIK